MSKNTKSERIKSPEYRVFIGKNIREYRIKEGYTLSDISDMTGIPGNTLLGIEKGEVTNIDYYVEYAKAVKYPLATLRQAKIKIEPLIKLPQERLKRIKLTREIRIHLVETGYLQNGKTAKELMEELERLKVISKGEITTTEIAGVMRNMIADDIVEKEKKVGNKNTYIIKNQ